MKHNLYKMIGLDMYLSTLSKDEYESVSKKIIQDSRALLPLTSWDIYSQGYNQMLNEAERIRDIKAVKTYAKKLNWQTDIDFIFKDETYEAIIITDLSQNIVWVNKGFSKMTGYQKKEVLNKTPKILQGNETLSTSKRSIKKKLSGDMPFKEIITNYKKDGTPYDCEVKIFPLSSDTNKTHFIALERQVG